MHQLEVPALTPLSLVSCLASTSAKAARSPTVQKLITGCEYSSSGVATGGRSGEMVEKKPRWTN